LTTRANLGKPIGLGNIKLGNLGTKIGHLKGIESIGYRGTTEEEKSLYDRRLRENKAGAEVHSTQIPDTSLLLPTSEPYSEVSAEEGKRAQTEKPTLGNRSSGRSWQ
jgi:hypothetical protein